MSKIQYKTRFIAGASCPECGDSDSLKLHVPQGEGEEYIQCVTCGMQQSRPKAESEADRKPEIIGLFRQ